MYVCVRIYVRVNYAYIIYLCIYLFMHTIHIFANYVYIYICKLSLYMDARIWKSIADQWQAAMKLYVQIAQVKT
jgi:hypothetical protein